MLFDVRDDESIAVLRRLYLKDQAELIIDPHGILVFTLPLEFLEMKRLERPQVVFVADPYDGPHSFQESLDDGSAVAAAEVSFCLNPSQGLVDMAV
jgi:hypothetical protein